MREAIMAIEAAIERAYQAALAEHKAHVATVRRSLGQRIRRIEQGSPK